ncbi:MAG: hypothetical protein K6L76_11185 [Agarilytica sp.]
MKMKLTRHWKTLLACACILNLNACVFYPRTYTTYNEKCDEIVKKMELEAKDMLYLSNCTGDECIDDLVILGFASAVTAVVSGTIVISGNIIYWMEEQAQC